MNIMKKLFMVFALAAFAAIIVGFAPIDENSENVIAVFSPADTVKAEIVDEGILEDGVFIAEDSITHEKATYRYEYIKNEAGNSFCLMYDEDVKWPNDEAEILAKFLNHEGGTAEEKSLIADIIAARIDSDEFPDTVRQVLTQRGTFYINTRFWNNLEEPSEEDVLIARKALESKKHTSYSQYILHKDEFSVIPEGVKTLKTENYIFY